jgi:hypothetical protein
MHKEISGFIEISRGSRAWTGKKSMKKKRQKLIMDDIILDLV